MNGKLRFSNALVILAMLVAFLNGPYVQPVSAEPNLVSFTGSYSQNFDTLANTGTGTTNPWIDDTVLTGWYAKRAGGTGGALAYYNAGDGSSNTGALYSFGTAAATERALGSIASGTTGTNYFGLVLKNDAALPIARLNVSYTGEQWRNGGNTAIQYLTFAYQVGTGLVDLTGGDWTLFPALNFASPIHTATASALDGNLAENQTAISDAITTLILPEQEVFLRWMDPNDSGNDHGLAVDNLSITATYASPITSLDLLKSTDKLDWQPVAGSLSGGFTLALDPVNPWYYFNVDNVASSEALSEGLNPFLLDPTSVPANYYTYWAAKGIDSSAVPGTPQYTLWQIINGLQPMFYLKVSDGPAYQLLDGYKLLVEATEEYLRVDGTYPSGTYRFFGAVKTEDGIDTLQTVNINFESSLQITDLSLKQKAGTAGAWEPVPGDLASGFHLALDAAVDFFYLDVDSLTATAPLEERYHPFTLDVSNLPLNFYDYWAAKNVCETCTGTWEPVMWQIITGQAPMFYLKVGSGPTYSLIDGLQYQTGQGDQPLRVSGDYPAGTYQFTGSVSSEGGASIALPVSMSFTNTACAIPNANYPLAGISDVQGSGTTSPMSGQNVTVEGQVTGVFLGSSGLNGFFLQDAGDDDPATSDGVFVYAPSYGSSPLNAGDWVQVSGKVSEYGGLTELGSLPANGIAFCGSGSVITPTAVNLPFATTADPERYEGMLITLPQTLTVTETYNLARYGEILTSVDGRLYNVNNDPAQTRPAPNNVSSITVDDGSSVQNPNPAPYLQGSGEDRTLRLGSTTTGVTGNLTSISNIYMVEPTAAVTFDTSLNPRPAAPADVGGQIKVAGFNLYNYFTTLNQTPYPADSPYSSSNTPRGATTALELQRQTTKLVEVIRGTGADVIGVFEVEKWAGANAAQTLVDAVNEGLALNDPDRFAVAPDPDNGFGPDVIKQAIFYKPAKVTPVDGGNLSANDPIFDRFPVAQVFESVASSEQFSVVMNHFKSKSSCPSSGDIDLGQGCWNLKRVQQAQTLLAWIETTLKPIDPDVLVMGDLNAYGLEDPIDAFVAGGMTNEIARWVSNPLDRYSYVYNGEAGYLDHSLANSSMNLQVSGVTIWHVNADEPSIIDYKTQYKTDDPYTPILYRASDHDPIITGLSLFQNFPPQAASAIPDQSAYWSRDWSYTFAAGTFTDANTAQGDVLSYRATLLDGSPLPSWLSFDAGTRTFSGTPPVDGIGVYDIKVTATDLSGASANTTFKLEVSVQIILPVILNNSTPMP